LFVFQRGTNARNVDHDTDRESDTGSVRNCDDSLGTLLPGTNFIISLAHFTSFIIFLYLTKQTNFYMMIISDLLEHHSTDELRWLRNLALDRRRRGLPPVPQMETTRTSTTHQGW